MALVNIDPKLGNEGVGERKLRQSIPRNRELADTDDPKAKLRDGDDATGKLADGNDPPWRAPAAGSVGT
jgi:hypothetical protein